MALVGICRKHQTTMLKILVMQEVFNASLKLQERVIAFSYDSTLCVFGLVTGKLRAVANQSGPQSRALEKSSRIVLEILANLVSVFASLFHWSFIWGYSECGSDLG
ncbi:hypothetical protein H0E87_031496, partial [Populus deltoides]